MNKTGASSILPSYLWRRSEVNKVNEMKYGSKLESHKSNNNSHSLKMVHKQKFV